MADHNILGKKGEQIAVSYLSSHSYLILEKNWRTGRMEVDIIASKDNELVIIEVKTRYCNFIVSPELNVNKKKQEFLIRAANAYIARNNISIGVRFDIIGIIVSESGRYKIDHIKNAFYPAVRTYR